MKKTLLILMLFPTLDIQAKAIWGPKYFPIGTKWTELRLDTTRYDSWYSRVDGEWIPNYEKIDYYVNEDTVFRGFYSPETHATKVNRYREGELDPLSYVLIECEFANESFNRDIVYISIIRNNEMPFPVSLYYFRCWTEGFVLSSSRLKNSLVGGQKITLIGTIQEIWEDFFGGEHKQTYAITDKGHMVIDGIGITAWAGPDCIFGPVEIGEAFHYYDPEYSEFIIDPDLICYPGESPFCTILAHFERDGEVLYDVWPEPGNENCIKGLKGNPSPSLQKEGIYDLQGRRLQKAPQKGMYIQGGVLRMK